MTTVKLIATSGEPRADALLADVAESLEGALGVDLRGLYLAGSYADRSAVPLSDLDLIAVLREGSDEKLTQRVADECAQRSPIRLDLAAVTTSTIAERFVALVPAFRLGTVLVYGADVREEVPLPTIDAFAAAWADRARRFMLRIRRLDSAECPLAYPDPDEEFFGYDRATVSAWYPAGVTQSTKELVAIVGSAATALVARVGGAYVTTKSECVRLYAARVSDEWTDLVRGAHDLCWTRLNYGVPISIAERSELRGICAKVLAFENHMLGQFASTDG